MYGKIFQQIYDGTLREDPMVRLVFMDMIILSDRDGHIDVTPESLSARTNVPLDVVLHAIKQLESEDLRSRSSKENGARIVLLDSHRDWGWKIVNHEYYRDLLNTEDRRKKDRERKRRQREKERQERVSRDSHALSRMSRHTDTDTDTDTDTKKENKKKKKGTGQTTYTAKFLAFWDKYPRKEKKQRAYRAWKRLPKGNGIYETIMSAVDEHKKTDQWKKDNGQFIPMPATWLNDRRWEDELKQYDPWEHV